jgi:hypothetical protein
MYNDDEKPHPNADSPLSELIHLQMSRRPFVDTIQEDMRLQARDLVLDVGGTTHTVQYMLNNPQGGVVPVTDGSYVTYVRRQCQASARFLQSLEDEVRTWLAL